MKVKTKVNWCRTFQQGVPKGSLVLKPIGANIKNLAEFLNKLQKWQDEKGELRELDLDIEVHFKKRSLDANAMMWSLYDVEATEMNAGKKIKDMTREEKKHAVKPEELYAADIQEYAPVVVITVPEIQIEFIRAEYRHKISEERDQSGNVRYKAHFSTSHFNTKQMHEWIERQFIRLAENGVKVASGSDIVKYWEEYSAARESDPNREYTSAEYKKKQPFCEACTKYLGQGGGSLAHIKARGMGRHPMEGLYFEADVMHLCDIDHMKYDSGKGRDEFLKEFPHLKKKINARLKREESPEEFDDKKQIPLM